MTLHDPTQFLHHGTPLARADSAVILIHGRGSSADGIISLSSVFADAPGTVFLAPDAIHGTWYPHRFLADPAQNEPWLSSALDMIDNLVHNTLAADIPSERIAIVGFSQGACLALEYAARHPRRYAFIGGLSGALIGPVTLSREPVDLQRTPILLGCADRDAHIPLEHVNHSAATLGAFNAAVTKQIYPGSAHTIFPEEIEWLQRRAKSLHGRLSRA